MPEGDTSALWGREIPIEPELIVRGTTGPAPGHRCQTTSDQPNCR